MKVVVASDHRGNAAREQVSAIVQQLGFEAVTIDNDSSSPVDYPDVAYQASNSVANSEADMAILICGTGIGMCIAANKVKGVRAALCFDELNAQISRQHNNANVLCLSGDLLGGTILRKIVEIWLQTEFLGGRHERRVNKIIAIEKGDDPSTV